MRKIETNMIKAIHTGKNWHSDNTTVTVEKTYGAVTQHMATVRLHGHIIAHVTYLPATGYMFAGVDRDTFRAWPTSTTRSRLRALGINASIRNNAAHIDGMAI